MWAWVGPALPGEQRRQPGCRAAWSWAREIEQKAIPALLCDAVPTQCGAIGEHQTRKQSWGWRFFLSNLAGRKDRCWRGRLDAAPASGAKEG